MSKSAGQPSSRRRFLRTSATAAAMIPLVNLVGCSDESAQPAPAKPAAAPAPKQAADTAAKSMAEQAGNAAESATTQAASQPAAQTLVKLEESNAQAQALGYRHDATTVDTASYPRYEAGQHCQSCQLFQAGQGNEAGWGGCSLFPGKLVNAEGWCSAYVPAA